MNNAENSSDFAFLGKMGGANREVDAAGPSRGEDPLRDRWCCGVTLRCRVAVAVAGGRAVSRGWPPAGRGSPCFIREERPTPRPASGPHHRHPN